jgi:DNA/RNA endonuclease YhcR with UshA esterase domain
MVSGGGGERPTASHSPPVQAGSSGIVKPNKAPAAGASGVVTAEKAGQFLNQRITVEMAIRSVGKATTTERYYLNSKASYRDNDNFAITFTRPVIDQLKAQGISDLSGIEAHFKGRTIRVTGMVSEYQSRAQVDITSLDQIQIVGPAS